MKIANYRVLEKNNLYVDYIWWVISTRSLSMVTLTADEIPLVAFSGNTRTSAKALENDDGVRAKVKHTLTILKPPSKHFKNNFWIFRILHNLYYTKVYAHARTKKNSVKLQDIKKMVYESGILEALVFIAPQTTD